MMSRKEFLLILLLVLLVCGPLSVSQAVESKIYWTDAGTDKIQCANLDGSNVQDLVTRPHRLGDPHGIALDVDGNKIYWADAGTDKIQCANLDGSNVQDLIYIKDVRSPMRITLDVATGKMYWIQTFALSSEIWRANLNGSGQQKILRTTLDSINGIALDAAGGKMYWTQNGLLASGKIRGANLNGSNVQTIVTGLGNPSGIALDVAAGKMYWTDSSRHKIQRANLDGSNVQDLVTRGSDAPSDIALDAVDGRMYWVEQRGNRIRRANLNGSNVQNLISGLSRSKGIALSRSAAEEPVQMVDFVPIDTSTWGLPEGAKARLGKGTIEDIKYSPDGKMLAVASSIGVWLYDTENAYQEVALLIGHTSTVNSVAFSPDGQTLASGSSDNTVRLWDAHTRQHIRTLSGHTEQINSVVFSPDGTTLASGSHDNTIRLWNVNTGRHKATLEHRSYVGGLAYSPNGDILISITVTGLYLWDTGTSTLRKTLTPGSVWEGTRSVVYSPDSRTIASVSDGLDLWNADTGKHIARLENYGYYVGSVTYSPDGRTLASTDYWSGTVTLWDAHTGRHIRTLTGRSMGIPSLAYSPDGLTLACSDYQGVRLWHVGTGKHIGMLTGHTATGHYGSVRHNSIVYSPDGETIASGSSDGTVRLWDIHTGQYHNTPIEHTEFVYDVAFSPDGNIIASVEGSPWNSLDPTVRLWSTASGEYLATLAHTPNVNSVAFSPQGNILASGSYDDTVLLWDVNTGRRLRTLTGHTGGVYSVSFSPDGNTLASGSGDDTVRLWDVDTGRHLRTLTGHTRVVYSVFFSPDGDMLASGSGDDTVRLWTVDTGRHLRTLTGHTSTVNSVFFSPDGNTLASGSDDGTVRLWAVDTGRHLRTLTGHTWAVNSVSFSPDGDTLASGNSDGTVLLWKVAPSSPQLPEDVNRDGVVNIIDLTLVASNFGETGANAADVNSDGVVNIVDLTLVAAAFGNTVSASPEIWSRLLDGILTRAAVEAWLREAQQMNLTDPDFQRGIAVLEQLLAAFTPKETILLPNYPNPFNPETWIPYQLATAADVSISIYAVDGTVVRTLSLGHQSIGMYHQRSRAAYWDGKNNLGEPVASGVYFYTLTADNFTATRKMLIRK